MAHRLKDNQAEVLKPIVDNSRAQTQAAINALHNYGPVIITKLISLDNQQYHDLAREYNIILAETVNHNDRLNKIRHMINIKKSADKILKAIDKSTDKQTKLIRELNHFRNKLTKIQEAISATSSQKQPKYVQYALGDLSRELHPIVDSLTYLNEDTIQWFDE